MKTNIDTLAEFAFETTFELLPASVVEEAKRLMVDSVGCALGGLSHPKGAIGVKYAKLQGAGARGEQATVLGTGDRVCAMAAAFANGELINALDFDAILPPGHVSPYVIPGALAAAETARASGKDLLCAVAVAHEMSNRIGKGLDYLRDIKNGKISPPPVHGYASTIFGATAAVGKVKRHSAEMMADAIGIAASMSPANAQWSWSLHVPTATIKYAVAGALTQAAMTGVTLAELGHTGDRKLLDDSECGWPRMSGSSRWSPEDVMPGLGTEWVFPAEQTYKPFPHCRAQHAPIQVVREIVSANGIKPSEIEGIKAWVEGFVMQPLWLNRKIEHVTQGQFSIAHGLSVAAHLIPPGKAWQSPEVVFDASVLALMDKVECEVHPDYETLLTANSASRPTRIEVRARGRLFVGETQSPKGTPSSNPSTRMTNDELSAKFVRNAEGVLSPPAIDRALQQLWGLEKIEDIGAIMSALSGKH